MRGRGGVEIYFARSQGGELLLQTQAINIGIEQDVL